MSDYTVTSPRVYTTARIESAGKILATPEDHLTPIPNARMVVPGGRSVGCAGGCPTVGGRIISPARVQRVDGPSSPHDHFAAGPNCRVEVSGIGRISGAGRCPTVGDGIISAAGVKNI